MKSDSLAIHFASGFKRFFSGVFLSRVTGLLRDLVMAFSFGDDPSVAAFMVAFRFSHLLRRFFGEGALQSAFIPQFEGLQIESREKASDFFKTLILLLFAFLLVLTFLGKLGFAFVLSFSSLSFSVREILALTSLLFPGLIFICLYGLNISLLQCYHSFFIANIAPAVCNFFWIGGALYFRTVSCSNAMAALAKCVVCGFVFQWLFTFFFTLPRLTGGIKSWFLQKFFPLPTEVKKLLKAFSLGAIGVGAVQINTFLDALFARVADLRGPVYLWYSIRLYQLALTIFGIVCVNTLVPLLSKVIKRGEIEKAKMIFSFGFQRIFTIMTLSTFAIFAIGFSAVNLIYGRGNFSSHAVQQTSYCLWAYGCGLLPATLVILYSSVLYAFDDFKTSAVVTTCSVGLNCFLNFLFIFGFHLGSVSIALATAISAFCNWFSLHYLLQKRGWSPQRSKKDLLSVAMGGFVSYSLLFALNQLEFHSLLERILQGTFLIQICDFCFRLFLFVSVLWVYALLFKARYLHLFVKEVFTLKKGDSIS